MYISIGEKEKMLKPCPLCGAPARIQSVIYDAGYEKTEIRCIGCGLTLEWTQEFCFSKAARVPKDINFVEAWNRRMKK